MRIYVSEEQRKAVLDNLGKMKVADLTILTKVSPTMIYQIASQEGRSAKTGLPNGKPGPKEKPPKEKKEKPPKEPEIKAIRVGKRDLPPPEVKHIHIETPAERRERILQYILEHKEDMTSTQMALALGVTLDVIERLAYMELKIRLLGTVGDWQALQPIKREKGVYGNTHSSSIAQEYWEEENKHKPKKVKPPEEE